MMDSCLPWSYDDEDDGGARCSTSVGRHHGTGISSTCQWENELTKSYSHPLPASRLQHLL